MKLFFLAVVFGSILGFGLAEEKADSLLIGAGGDFMPNGPMMQMAFPETDGYQSLWLDDLEALMHIPDFFLANHETAAAECVDAGWNDVGKPCPMEVGSVYNFAKWSVNNHPRIAADMVALGIDVVSLANNHIMDRGPLGLNRTIDALDAAGLQHMGARKKSDLIPWYTTTTTRGWKVAWIGCAEHLTDRRARGSDQVLYCSEDSDLIPQIQELSADPDIDAVLVALHWGKIHDVDVYQTNITSTMRNFARSLIKAGASAVIGAHPHVLSGWETYTVDNRDGLILYSLGNMMAIQGYSSFSLKRCREMHSQTTAECQRLLLAKALAFFHLVPHPSGKASAKEFSYACTTWSGPGKGMVLLEEQLCKKGYASQFFEGAARLPGLKAKYKRTKSDRFCRHNAGQKALPDVNSVAECMAVVDADPHCGPQFASNGKHCRCILLGNTCDERTSSKGNSLYELEPAPEGQWAKEHSGAYCSSSGRKNLPDVSSVEECRHMVEEDPDCGDTFTSNGKQCRCMYYGQTCQKKDSSRGNDVYKFKADIVAAPWRQVRSNMYCGSSGRKSLPDVESVEGCQGAVDADSDCGDTFTSNGKQCQCMEEGKSCDYKVSSDGTGVWKRLPDLAHITEALHGHGARLLSTGVKLSSELQGVPERRRSLRLPSRGGDDQNVTLSR